MKKRIVLSVLLIVLAVVVFASWQYRLVCALLLVATNRRWLSDKAQSYGVKHGYGIIVGVLLVCLFFSLPNYFQRGRHQLHYLDAKGQRVSTPLLPYIANVLVPEKEAMNLCMKANAVMPYTLMNKITKVPNRFAADAQSDFWHGKTLGFYTPYYHTGNSGSFVYGQVCNIALGTDYDAIYINRPKHYDSSKTYPVVFFCHGYMGSWELYQGILSGVEDCIVVSLGTKDLKGKSFKVGEIFSHYIPYLESLGYKVDNQQLHIMGLSNGGQAVNQAIASYDKKFKSITFISNGCHTIKHTPAKVMFIGGGRDGSASGQPTQEKRLRTCGTKTAIYYDKNANHFIFASQSKKVVDFINENL